MMDKAQELPGDLEVEVFEKNAIGRRFYVQYGFEPLEEKMHEETGERLLRLKFTAWDALRAARSRFQSIMGLAPGLEPALTGQRFAIFLRRCGGSIRSRVFG